MENHTSLNRELTTFKLVVFGLALVTPMIVFGIYGVIAEASHGMVSSAFFITMVAMLLTTYSYGQMVKVYPSSGSSYIFVRKSINSHLGFMTGWAILLDYFFLPMVIWLIGSSYLADAFPLIPTWIWIIAFIILTSGINIIGVKISTNINLVMLFFEILVIVLFVYFSIRSVLSGGGTGSMLTIEPFFNPQGSLKHVLAGSAIAAYSFIGFDAVTTMSEETINPKKQCRRQYS